MSGINYEAFSNPIVVILCLMYGVGLIVSWYVIKCKLKLRGDGKEYDEKSWRERNFSAFSRAALIGGTLILVLTIVFALVAWQNRVQIEAFGTMRFLL